jgi:hypothetical protein
MSFDLLYHHFHIFRYLNTPIFLQVDDIQTDYKFCNYYDTLYMLLLSLLVLWMEIHDIPAVTN